MEVIILLASILTVVVGVVEAAAKNDVDCNVADHTFVVSATALNLSWSLTTGLQRVVRAQVQGLADAPQVPVVQGTKPGWDADPAEDQEDRAGAGQARTLLRLLRQD